MAAEVTGPSSLDREEQRVEAHSSALKKELGLRDLVLQQIVYVVGTIWVGTAAKLGHSQLIVLARGDVVLLSAAGGRSDSPRAVACRSRAACISGRGSGSAS